MKNYSAKEIKNIVLIGAPGSGKTTLAEAMAYEGKVIDRRGAVETNNTLSDNTDIEHEYKRSIYSTILFTEFMERKLNIIDCPGSDDFCGSLFSAFKVGDVGVMVFNAQNGWEVGSEIQARYSRELSKPLIGVINQLDAEKANFEGTVESIRAASRVKPVIVQYPVNQGPGFNAFIDVLMMKLYRFKDENGTREELDIPAEEMERATELNRELVEMAAENDEALMELYFEKGTLTQDDIRSGLKIGLSRREVMPLFCTSGKRDVGTKRLMEFIINVAPGPLKAPKFLSTEGEEIAADQTQPAVAFVFKSQIEPHIGEISYLRVIRGKLTEGMELLNTRTGNKEKVSQLFADHRIDARILQPDGIYHPRRTLGDAGRGVAEASLARRPLEGERPENVDVVKILVLVAVAERTAGRHDRIIQPKAAQRHRRIEVFLGFVYHIISSFFNTGPSLQIRLAPFFV